MNKAYIESLKEREDIVIYPISPQTIRGFEFIRGYCERNTCGQYNRNWMCPPNLPDVQDLQENLRRYKEAYLVKKRYGELDPLSGKALIEKDFFEEMSKIHESLFENEHVVLAAGECKQCSVCRKVFDKPCDNEKMALASLESYGIEVNHLMKLNNIKRTDLPGDHHLVGLVCLND